MSNQKQTTALVVEDEDLLRDMLVKKIAERGHIVLSAPNGKKGLAVALDKHPDIILMDIMMPEMDGIAVLRKLRQDTWGKGVSDPRLVASSLEEKSFEYLIKADWDIDEIIDKIDEKLNVLRP
jgi:CheY-like chemotaxis protein